MREGLFDAVLASLHDRGRDLQKTSCTRQGEQPPQGHPWPVLHELNETYQVGALPADDDSGLVLYPAAGLLRYYRGERLVLINRDETPYDGAAGLVLREPIGQVFAQLSAKEEAR